MCQISRGGGGGDDCVVLDLFMGSGTTALAAIANGAGWVGIDISNAYITMAETRICEWIEAESRATV